MYLLIILTTYNVFSNSSDFFTITFLNKITLNYPLKIFPVTKFILNNLLHYLFTFVKDQSNIIKI